MRFKKKAMNRIWGLRPALAGEVNEQVTEQLTRKRLIVISMIIN